MDNRVISQIKRGLRVTTGYLTALIIFAVFSMTVISFAKNDVSAGMIWLSVITFLLMFFSVYTEMRDTAFKEKRPQYDINPPPFKGLLYGIIGIAPLVIVEIVLMLIKVPEDLLVLKRRVWQGFASPLYWIARLFGNTPVCYILAFIVVIIIAGLGYYAGYKGVYPAAAIRRKLGLNKKVKKAEKKK